MAVGYLSKSMQQAIDELSKLPGIGRKSAQRLVFYLLKLPREEVVALAKSLVNVKDLVSYCSICYNLTEISPCSVCSNSQRDRSVICIVDEANDVIAFERTGDYKGLYHVLGGVLSPLDGIGPEELKIKELLKRLNDDIKEVIFANNPNVEGEATALYLSKLIKPLEIKTTRIARGLPVGADIEYVDEITLTKALEGRSNY